MKRFNSSTTLLDSMKARTLSWLVAGSVFALVFSSLVSWVNLRTSAEREVVLEVQAMSKSFRAEILSGQIKAAESQMHQALQLKPSESAKVLDVEMKEIFDDSQAAPVKWLPSLSNERIRWTGFSSLAAAAPVYFDQERNSLFGYVGLSRHPDLNWALFFTIFGSLMLGQLIFAWILRVSVIRIGRHLSRQLAALSANLEQRMQTADPNGGEIEELNRIREAFLHANQEINSLNLKGRSNKTLRQVAHDIRSPLTAMNLGIQSLGEIPKPTRDLLETAFRRMEIIASDILTENETQLVTTAALKENFEGLLKEKYAEHVDRQLNWGLKFDGDTGRLLNVPLSALMRNLSNIMNNAAEASPAQALVELHVRLDGGFLTIAVIDEGPGIPLSAQTAILRGGLSSKPEGHGLGLASARHFAHSYGGDLVLCRREKGFEVVLTLALTHLSARETQTAARTFV